MLADSFRTGARRTTLVLAGLLPLLAACPGHGSDAPAPHAPDTAKVPPDPTPPDHPASGVKREAPFKTPGPATANMPAGAPPADDVIASTDGATETVRKYHPNGSCYVEYRRKKSADGKETRDGPITAWHENGEMLQDGAYTDGKLSGHWRYWDDMGQLEREGDYDEGKQEGDWKSFHPGEKPKSAGFFHAGMSEGPWKYWHSNGQLMSEGEFVNNKKEGVWTYYSPDGKVDVDKTGTYQDNHKVK